MQLKNLSLLPINRYGIVKNIIGKDNTKRRLLDLGLVKGTKIKPVLVSPSNGLRAYEFRSSLIAIRKEDAENIIIGGKNEFYWYFAKKRYI